MLRDHTSINKLTPRILIDYFISDMLLPTLDRHKRKSALTLYAAFEVYCNSNGLACPLTVSGFGIHMARRFQKIRYRNEIHYFCEFKDDVVYPDKNSKTLNVGYRRI